MQESVWFWVGFNVFVVVMLWLDLAVFHKKDSEVKMKEAIGWSVFWIALALVFNAGVYHVLDHQKALEFFTAYLLEKSLSIDNLFVFILIFNFFKIKPRYQHRVLFWGIFGALLMRALFIFAGVALIQRFSWLMYIFGLFLIYSGIKILFDKDNDEEIDPEHNIAIRLFRKIMPVSRDMSQHHFFVKHENKWHATPFFLALLFIETSDILFALDSIPAVLSVSKDVFIVYTSNIFAILGLRSLYFALNRVIMYFYYLKYALAAILSFIGFKMCINEFAHTLHWSFHISNLISLSVIIVLIVISITASVWRKRNAG